MSRPFQCNTSLLKDRYSIQNMQMTSKCSQINIRRQLNHLKQVFRIRKSLILRINLNIDVKNYAQMYPCNLLNYIHCFIPFVTWVHRIYSVYRKHLWLYVNIYVFTFDGSGFKHWVHQIKIWRDPNAFFLIYYKCILQMSNLCS